MSNQQIGSPDLLKPAEVTAMLGVSRTWLYGAAGNGLATGECRANLRLLERKGSPERLVAPILKGAHTCWRSFVSTERIDPETMYVLLRADGPIAGIKRDPFEPTRSMEGGRVVAYTHPGLADPEEYCAGSPLTHDQTDPQRVGETSGGSSAVAAVQSMTWLVVACASSW
jgi:hypothetical protein